MKYKKIKWIILFPYHWTDRIGSQGLVGLQWSNMTGVSRLLYMDAVVMWWWWWWWCCCCCCCARHVIFNPLTWCDLPAECFIFCTFLHGCRCFLSSLSLSHLILSCPLTSCSLPPSSLPPVPLKKPGRLFCVGLGVKS